MRKAENWQVAQKERKNKVTPYSPLGIKLGKAIQTLIELDAIEEAKKHG